MDNGTILEKIGRMQKIKAGRYILTIVVEAIIYRVG